MLSHFRVHYILNVSREIDNFYPGILHYMNVREWDIETADLMKHWEDTHRYISRARYLIFILLDRFFFLDYSLGQAV